MNSFVTIPSRIRRKWESLTGNLLPIRPSQASDYKNARGSRIILYHGICRRQHTRFNSLFITKETFERHLLFYRKHFHVISLEDYFMGRGDTERFNICLTFDDGFANNHDYVLPLMEKYQVPATFFITGIRQMGYDILWNDFLSLFQKYGPQEWIYRQTPYRKGPGRRYLSTDDGHAFRDLLQSGGFEAKAEFIRSLADRRPHITRTDEKDFWLQMTPEQIRAVAASPLATIGCHGLYHNDLSRLTTEQTREELTRSSRYLMDLTGRPVNALAFPYGNYNRTTIAEARAAGFTRLLATDFRFPGDAMDPTMRERMTINPYISITRQMQAIIHGKY